MYREEIFINQEDIEWLNFIDSKYNQNKKGRNNLDFIYYPKLNKINFTESVNLIFRKVNDFKTQFIFKDEYNRAVYFSDVDIINILIKAENEVYQVFIDVMKTFLEEFKLDEMECISFEINGENFCYVDFFANYITGERDTLLNNSFIHCIAGFSLNYRDILLLINLIINKEFLVDSARGLTRVHRQIKKFYILSRFYRDKLFENELIKNEFKTNAKLEEVYYNNTIAKEIDLIFEKIEILQ